MVIDPVYSIVFEAEGEEADTMRRPPRDPSEPLFTAALCGLEPSAGSAGPGTGRRPVCYGTAPRPTGTGCTLACLRGAGRDQSRPCGSSTVHLARPLLRR